MIKLLPTFVALKKRVHTNHLPEWRTCLRAKHLAGRIGRRVGLKNLIHLTSPTNFSEIIFPHIYGC